MSASYSWVPAPEPLDEAGLGIDLAIIQWLANYLGCQREDIPGTYLTRDHLPFLKGLGEAAADGHIRGDIIGMCDDIEKHGRIQIQVER
jgi:hypothetical protein